MTTDEQIIAADAADQRKKDSQRDLGSEFTYLLILKRRKMPVVERHVILKQRNIAGDSLIWGSSLFGVWNSQKWGTVLTNSFILGHSGAAILGTSLLGSRSSSFTTVRVVNPNRTYIDNLYGTTFKDTSGTSTWTGGGAISFTSGQQAISLPIYLNNETLGSATLTASDSGSLTYMLSADGGTNYETVTKGASHTFTNQGTDLRFKISASSTGSVSQIKVEY